MNFLTLRHPTLKVIALLGSVILPLLVEAQTIDSVKRASLSPSGNQSGENFSYDPEIDGSGRFVVFTSLADNFAAPGATLGAYHEHVYLRDVALGSTTQLDVTSSGETGSPSYSFSPFIRTFGSGFDPHISRDGKVAVFISGASNISPDGQGETFGSWVYHKNLESGSIKRIPKATASDNTKAETPAYLAINADGTVVVVMSIIGDIADTTCATCAWELTVYKESSGTTQIISTGVTGNKFNPGISDDGRFVVFENQNGDFSAPTYAFLYDLELGQLTALNGGDRSLSPAISGDGAFVAYTDASLSSQIKLLERLSGNEINLTSGINGEPANGISEFSSLSIDGRYLAFLSSSNNLVEDDANNLDDIFVYDRVTQKTTLVSVQAPCSGVNTTEDFNTGPPSISSDGKTITFTVLERLNSSDVKDADGNTIEPADSNNFDDVYVAQVDYESGEVLFKKGLKPATPFVTVNCTGADARIQIQEIVKQTSANSSSPGAKKTNSLKKVTQQIIVSSVDSSNKPIRTVKKLIAKRNEVASSGLPPGNYSAQLQAQAKYSNGKVVRTKPSSPSFFTISQ